MIFVTIVNCTSTAYCFGCCLLFNVHVSDQAKVDFVFPSVPEVKLADQDTTKDDEDGTSSRSALQLRRDALKVIYYCCAIISIYILLLLFYNFHYNWYHYYYHLTVLQCDIDIKQFQAAMNENTASAGY